jgi:asparagine synthase (glutamine-hydrolysing)
MALHLTGQPPAEEETFHAKIFALPPAGALLATGARRTSWKYWRVDPLPTLRLKDDRDYSDALLELLSTIVDQYQRLPGTFGVTLSSGLDSTTVAALLARRGRSSSLIAFCWVAPDVPEADESKGSHQVRDHLGVRSIDISAGHLGPLSRDLETLVRPSEPGAGFYLNLWNTTFSSVRQHGVSTLFSGNSGDNLFGGDTSSYPDLFLTLRWRRLLSELRAHSRSTHRSLGEILRRMLFRPLADAWLHTAPSPSRFAPRWLSQRMLTALPEPVSRSYFPLLPGRISRLLTLEENMLPEISRQLTLLAFQHGIDFRHPLLDHRLFDFSARLPSEQTFIAGLRKVIMRRSMQGLLPAETLAQKVKTIPRAIAHRSFRGQDGERAFYLLRDMRAAELGLVDEERLRDSFIRFRKNGQERPLFFHAMTLEAWLRRYF